MDKAKEAKYIFVVGGVMSGVGKGITTASIGQILQARGYNVSAIKMDPYINVDAGTMDLLEHGEIFVTADGDETDQDIGNYERFLNKNIYRENYMTTGRVYQSVINRERNLGYQGKCVQVVPHIPIEIRDRIEQAVQKSQADIMIIEIGGTVGEYENLLFLEAARMMKLYKPNDVLFVMVSYLPIPNKIGEMKTKPTQHAVRSLQGAGIQPDFLVARSEQAMDDIRKEKLSINCNLPLENVIPAADVESVYDIPLNFEKHNLGVKILEKFNLPKREIEHQAWLNLAKNSKITAPEITVGIADKHIANGSYDLKDAYLSVTEALKHAAIYHKLKIKIHWLKVEKLVNNNFQAIKDLDGLIMPQGWENMGAESKIKVIQYCRENKKPFLGIAQGMQMAVIEFARNVAQIKNANSIKVDNQTKEAIINKKKFASDKEEKLINAGFLKLKGENTLLRLGAWPAVLQKNTLLAKIYEKYHNHHSTDNPVATNSAKVADLIYERHRHYCELNNNYRARLGEAGLIISALSPDNDLVEAIEIKDHPFFIGVHYNPEFNSRPLRAHPLFLEFVEVCKKLKK